VNLTSASKLRWWGTFTGGPWFKGKASVSVILFTSDGSTRTGKGYDLKIQLE